MGCSVWVGPNLSCSWGRKKKKKDLGPGWEMGWGQVLSWPGRERRSLARGTGDLTARSGGTRGPSLRHWRPGLARGHPRPSGKRHHLPELQPPGPRMVNEEPQPGSRPSPVPPSGLKRMALPPGPVPQADLACVPGPARGRSGTRGRRRERGGERGLTAGPGTEGLG